jgi:mono/diheme cytochrome c family protein
MTRRSTVHFLLPVCLLVAACGTARRDEPEKSEFKPANAQIALGEKIFKQQCDFCHPGGASGFGPALNNKPLPGFAMKFQIRHGLGGMPAFDSTLVSDQERDAIIEYLKALRDQD